MSLPKEYYRKIVLSGDISAETVKTIIETILTINNDDDEKQEDYKGWERKPIKIFINSFGGSVYDGLALVDIIKQSKTPVHTICIGSCMSMGLWIYLSGHKRFMGNNATLMFHDISSLIADTAEGIKLELDEMIRLRDMFNQTVVTSSDVTEDTLNNYITKKSNWYISSTDAYKLKLSDGFYVYG